MNVAINGAGGQSEAKRAEQLTEADLGSADAAAREADAAREGMDGFDEGLVDAIYNDYSEVGGHKFFLRVRGGGGGGGGFLGVWGGGGGGGIAPLANVPALLTPAASLTPCAQHPPALHQAARLPLNLNPRPASPHAQFKTQGGGGGATSGANKPTPSPIPCPPLATTTAPPSENAHTTPLATPTATTSPSTSCFGPATSGPAGNASAQPLARSSSPLPISSAPQQLAVCGSEPSFSLPPTAAAAAAFQRQQATPAAPLGTATSATSSSSLWPQPQQPTAPALFPAHSMPLPHHVGSFGATLPQQQQQSFQQQQNLAPHSGTMHAAVGSQQGVTPPAWATAAPAPHHTHPHTSQPHSHTHTHQQPPHTVSTLDDEDTPESLCALDAFVLERVGGGGDDDGGMLGCAEDEDLFGGEEEGHGFGFGSRPRRDAVTPFRISSAIAAIAADTPPGVCM